MKSSSFLEWLRFMLIPIKYPLSPDSTNNQIETIKNR